MRVRARTKSLPMRFLCIQKSNHGSRHVRSGRISVNLGFRPRQPKRQREPRSNRYAWQLFKPAHGKLDGVRMPKTMSIYDCPNCSERTAGIRTRFRIGRMRCAACGVNLRWSRSARWLLAIFEQAVVWGALAAAFYWGSIAILFWMVIVAACAPILAQAFMPLRFERRPSQGEPPAPAQKKFGVRSTP